MNRLTVLIAIAFALLRIPATGQGFQQPDEGNAVIYFVRVTDWGALINFKYFDGDKFIGKFAGKNYMRYECPAGEHLMWASSESKSFMPSQLEAVKTYIVIVDVAMGAIKAAVSLNPIDANDKTFKRAKDLVMKKAPVSLDAAKVLEENAKLTKFISDQLAKYEKERKNDPDIEQLLPDMSIPEELLEAGENNPQ